MSRPRPRFVAVLAGASLLAALVASPVRASAATLVVGPGGDGQCLTPQYATIAAAVAAASSGDTILICPGTHALTSTVVVDKDLAFTGLDASTTIIDGGSTVQLFDAHGRTVSFTHLSLRHGASNTQGAAVYADTVTVTESIFADNEVSGDNPDGTLSGGAIDAKTVTVVGSQFTGNLIGGSGNTGITAQGGAINADTVTVAASTFEGNMATASSAYPDNQASGGAIQADSVTAWNSTFDGNSAMATGKDASAVGGAISTTDLSLTNDTLVGNVTAASGDHAASSAAAIWAVTVHSLNNTIVAGNGTQCRGTVIDVTGTFATDASCQATVTTLAALDLGAPADNGGPTLTIALGPSSVALDAGDDTICAALPVNSLDQRGAVRPAGTHCDIGAYERVAPSITSFTPTTGPAGTPVLVYGKGFLGTSAIGFVHAAATTWTVYDDTMLAVTVPVGAFTGPITLTTPVGTVTSAGSFIVDVPAPTITGVAPASGPIGTVISITGTGLAWATAAAVNGTAVTGLMVMSPTTVTGRVAPGTTSGPVTVTSPGGTAVGGVFTVTPTIAAISPTSGPIGTRVTIRGSGFTGATAAAVHGTPLTGMTVINDTTITGRVATGTTSGTVTVTTPGGTATSAGTFTVSLAPTVTGFSPLSGTPGTLVTISGNAFHYVRSVTIGGKPASFTVRSQTTIVATVPAGAVTGPISVTSTYGTGTSARSFLVLP